MSLEAWSLEALINQFRRRRNANNFISINGISSQPKQWVAILSSCCVLRQTRMKWDQVYLSSVTSINNLHLSIKKKLKKKQTPTPPRIQRPVPSATGQWGKKKRRRKKSQRNYTPVRLIWSIINPNLHGPLPFFLSPPVPHFFGVGIKSHWAN